MPNRCLNASIPSTKRPIRRPQDQASGTHQTRIRIILASPHVNRQGQGTAGKGPGHGRSGPGEIPSGQSVRPCHGDGADRVGGPCRGLPGRFHRHGFHLDAGRAGTGRRGGLCGRDPVLHHLLRDRHGDRGRGAGGPRAGARRRRRGAPADHQHHALRHCRGGRFRRHCLGLSAADHGAGRRQRRDPGTRHRLSCRSSCRRCPSSSLA